MSWHIHGNLGTIFYSNKHPFNEHDYPSSMSSVLSYQEWQTICAHLNDSIVQQGLWKWRILYWISLIGMMFVWVPFILTTGYFFTYFWVWFALSFGLQLGAIFAFRAARMRAQRLIDEYCLELSSVYANRGLHFHYTHSFHHGTLQISQNTPYQGYQQVPPVYQQAPPVYQQYTNVGVASYNAPHSDLPMPPSYNAIANNTYKHYNV